MAEVKKVQLDWNQHVKRTHSSMLPKCTTLYDAKVRDLGKISFKILELQNCF